MNPECRRIADQLRRALRGDAWHGPPLSELLDGIEAGAAGGRPVPSAHSVWELVLHIEIYLRIALDAIGGAAMPELYGSEKDWPAPGRGEGDWNRAKKRLFETGEQLASTVEDFRDARLGDTVPGRQYDFYYLFHGLVQHSLYHGGQIALLKRAFAARQE